MSKRADSPRWMVYGLAAALTLAALYLRQQIEIPPGPRPLVITFVFPIIVSALLGGLWPGLFATLLSALCIDRYLTVAPSPDNINGDFYYQLQLAILSLNGILVSVMSEVLRNARLKENTQGQQLTSIQHQLAQVETRFQASFEQAAVGICLNAPDTRWLQVNHKLCEIVGYPEEELMQMSCRDISHPDDLKTEIELVQRTLNGELSSYHIEKRYLRKGGRPVWVDMTASLVRKSDSTPDFFIGVIVDIDARKQAELKLQEAQRLAKMGHWTWDLANGEVVWSEEIYRVFGRDPSLPPAGYAELSRYFTHESWLRLSAAIDEARSEGTAYTVEVELTRPDGQPGWAICRGLSEIDALGKIVELHGTVQDVTERKQEQLAELILQEQAIQNLRQARLATLNLMEEAVAANNQLESANAALRASEQRLLLAQEGGHVGIWEWDPATDQVYWSPECERLYGLPSKLPRTNDEWRARVHSDDLPLIDAQWEEHINKGEPFEVEYRFRHGSGEFRWLISKGKAQYDDAGKPIRISGVNLDITERKLAEEQSALLQAQLFQAQKMEVIGRLTGGIAHDFNNVLASIMGYTELALERYVPDEQTKLAAYLNEIKRGSDRAREMVAKLLTFCRAPRVDSGAAMDLEPAVIDICQLLQTNVPAGIQLRYQVSSCVPAVDMDMVGFHQILSNLIINARDAMENPGQIEISLTHNPLVKERCCSCRQLIAGEFVELTVRDEGPGIPEDVVEHIFDPFFTTKAIGKGTGMGLSVVHGIVHEHGGHILVKSNPNIGTAFRLFFPLCETIDQEQIKQTEISPSNFQETIKEKTIKRI